MKAQHDLSARCHGRTCRLHGVGQTCTAQLKGRLSHTRLHHPSPNSRPSPQLIKEVRKSTHGFLPVLTGAHSAHRSPLAQNPLTACLFHVTHPQVGGALKWMERRSKHVSKLTCLISIMPFVFLLFVLFPSVLFISLSHHGRHRSLTADLVPNNPAIDAFLVHRWVRLSHTYLTLLHQPAPSRKV